MTRIRAPTAGQDSRTSRHRPYDSDLLFGAKSGPSVPAPAWSRMSHPASLDVKEEPGRRTCASRWWGPAASAGILERDWRVPGTTWPSSHEARICRRSAVVGCGSRARAGNLHLTSVEATDDPAREAGGLSGRSSCSWWLCRLLPPACASQSAPIRSNPQTREFLLDLMREVFAVAPCVRGSNCRLIMRRASGRYATACRRR